MGFGRPGGTRTPNQGVMSALLLPLSYRPEAICLVAHSARAGQGARGALRGGRGSSMRAR